MSELRRKRKNSAVLVLVEGPSDKDVLLVSISEFLEQYDLDAYFCILDDQCVGPDGGDITSQDYVDTENLEPMISRYMICPELRKKMLKEKDIACIIQIADTDGAFIQAENLIEKKEIPGIPTSYYPKEKTFYYNEDSIYVFSLTNGKSRNARKSANMKYLAEKEMIQVYHFTQAQMEESEEEHTRKRRHLPDADPINKLTPYHIFYFSCNMDHFTCGKANLRKWDKIPAAEEFINKYGDSMDEMKAFLEKYPGTVKGMNYKESWEFITNNCESLHKHTNINLLFEMTREELLRETAAQ